MFSENAVPSEKLTKVEIEESWPTVYDVASSIRKIDLDNPNKNRVRAVNAVAVTGGLKPEAFPLEEGYFKATPEQLASLLVPVTVIGEVVHGFQRDARDSKSHARKIAKEMIKGVEMPPITVTIMPDLNGNDCAAVSDGQHRAVASIIARVPVEVNVKRRSLKEAGEFFSNQSKSKPIKREQTILTGSSELEEYIQDAVTSDDHPWSDLISRTIGGGDKRRMTVNTAALLIGGYVYNSLAGTLHYYTTNNEKFDKAKADELAGFIKAFGTKTTNPLAFRSSSLKGITNAAICVFQRNSAVQQGDKARWDSHMPKFLFEDYSHILNRHKLLAQALVDHWNKRLPEDRKVTIVTYR
jgi:hypothetical protein